MSWKRITFTAADLKSSRHLRLQEEFRHLFEQTGGPEGMALFATLTMPQQVEYYISPGSFPAVAALAESYGAVEAPPPPRGSLGLQVGHHGAAERLLK